MLPAFVMLLNFVVPVPTRNKATELGITPLCCISLIGFFVNREYRNVTLQMSNNISIHCLPVYAITSKLSRLTIHELYSQHHIFPTNLCICAALITFFPSTHTLKPLPRSYFVPSASHMIVMVFP